MTDTLVHIINDISDYIHYTEKCFLDSELVLYRGQAVEIPSPQNGKLLPGIARDNNRIDTTKNEIKMITELSRLGSNFLKDCNDQWEILIDAQHYGMKTRLLDWTSNPLVALWFACSSYVQGDVNVFVLNSDNLERQTKSGPFELQSTQVIRPKMKNSRIIAQHGWFTVHKYSQRSKQFVPLEQHRLIRTKIKEIVIIESARKDLLKSLDRLGINSKSIFPDLGGLCQYINWRNNLEPKINFNTYNEDI